MFARRSDVLRNSSSPARCQPGRRLSSKRQPMKPAIAVVEPQMENLFHAPFNAALLHAVALAWPSVPLSFRAFPGHMEVVRQILSEHAPELMQRIAWRTADLPSSGSVLARWRQNSGALREIFRTGERVLFCSASRMQLLQLKRTMGGGRHVARVVLHGDLELLEQPVAESFPRSLFALRRVLRGAPVPGLRYLLLGRSIHDNIPSAYRDVFADAGIIDHPYHFPPLGPVPQGPLTFGIFGDSGDAWVPEEIARAVKAVDPAIHFRIIGFLSNATVVNRVRDVLDDAGEDPIPRQIFRERASSITHTLWLAKIGGFRLRASGTFFDALAYGKPLVYTANPYLDPYFAMEPALGVRVTTLAEVPKAILRVSREFSEDGYASSRAAIEQFRRRFTPQALAQNLPEAIGWD